MPDATPTSIAPPSPVPRHKRPALWRVAQLLLVALALYYVGHALVRQWREYRDYPVHIAPHWPMLLGSGVVVVAAYLLLVEVWRRILVEMRARIPFAPAARIWFISVLGQYVPGRVWQIIALGKLAEREAVPPAAAATSAIVNTVVNIAVGLVIAMIASYRALNQLLLGYSTAAIAITVLAVVGVLAMPALVPHVTALARRATGKGIDLGSLPPRAVYIAIAGNVFAWLLFGWAFQLLVAGVLGAAPGKYVDYLAAYSLSYVIGYLAFVMPAGAVVREVVQTSALTTLAGVRPKEAAIIAVVSRLWLTLLQVLPGLVYLARSTRLMPKPDDSRPTR